MLFIKKHVVIDSSKEFGRSEMVERSVLTVGMRIAITDPILKKKLEAKIKRERNKSERDNALAEDRIKNDGYVIISKGPSAVEPEEEKALQLQLPL